MADIVAAEVPDVLEEAISLRCRQARRVKLKASFPAEGAVVARAPRAATNARLALVSQARSACSVALGEIPSSRPWAAGALLARVGEREANRPVLGIDEIGRLRPRLPRAIEGKLTGRLPRRQLSNSPRNLQRKFAGSVQDARAP